MIRLGSGRRQMPKLITDPWDRQEDAPFAYCDLCGGEIYYGEVCVRAGDVYLNLKAVDAGEDGIVKRRS